MNTSSKKYGNAINKRLRNPNKQQGLVLFIALVVLVAMTLAGIALLRQAGAGLGIIGNLAFKENATTAADLGVEAARAWLKEPTNLNLLTNDNASSGYYSSWDPTFNPLTFNWTNSTSAAALNDGAGNDVRYVIHRLCSTANAPILATVTQKCVTADVEGSGGTKVGGKLSFTQNLQPYYRLTARAAGPRNTLSYVQVLMY
jgi:type IV pilus assembly protein PilX